MSSDKKLKIIHTEASPHWGGQEIRIFEEMKWFREQGHEMILIAPDNGTLYKRCKEEGFQVISVYFTKPRTLINIAIMLWIIWRLKPNAVATHSSTDSWASLVAAFLLKIRKRVRYRHVSAPVKGNFLNKLQYSSLANCIITTGKCIKDILIKNLKINQNKIHVLATPVRKISDLPSKEEARDLLQKELNLGEYARFIGQVSVLRGWKGHPFLFDAFFDIASNNPNLHLVIVGNGSMMQCLQDRKLSSSFGNRIHLVGHKDNVHLYFKAFECAILASTHNEGIPQSLLQSMYVGTPVIGTKVGGIPEIIIDDETGYLAEPQDPESLNSAIMKVLEDLKTAKRISINCQKQIEKLYTWEFIGAKILRLFQN
jgi:glycosyltransferase involved in cell wall biosynthesis